MSSKLQLIKGDFQFGYAQLSSSSHDVPVRCLDSIPELTGGAVTGGNTVGIHYYGKIGEAGLMASALAVHRDGHKIILAEINPGDEHQQWVVDSNYGRGVVLGSSFAMVNRATGQAIWRSRGEGNFYLSLMRFGDGPCYQDESALWKKKGDKDEFCCINTANNECYLHVDDGNNVVLQKAKRGFSLKFGGSSGKIWKIVPLLI